MNTNPIEQELTTAVDGLDTQQQFAVLGQTAFLAAGELAKGCQQMTGESFAIKAERLVRTLRRLDTLDAATCWNGWPSSPEPFGPYHRVGQSAMDTALLFARSVENVLEVAKVLSVGVSDILAVDPDRYGEWLAAFVDEAERSVLPSFTEWPMRERHRDCELLVRKIQNEIAQARIAADDDDEYGPPMAKGVLAKQLKINADTLGNWLKEKPPRIRVKDVTYRTVRVHRSVLNSENK